MWRVSKNKTVDIYVLLLNDALILLQKVCLFYIYENEFIKIY